MASARRNNTVRILGAAGRNRSALLRSTALQASVLLVPALPVHAQPAANAHPTGGTVVAGSAAISSTGSNTQITQSSQRAAIDWKSFDVGSQQRVTFSQPSASAVALNRVTGPDPSQIAGRIDANGQIILVNQSGVNFYKGAQVNTAGLIVTTSNVTDANFMAGGAMAFNQPGKPNAKIDNQGNITVKQAGLAALVAPQVANSGTISAKLGHVILAGAKTATLDLYGDGLLSLDVSNAVTQAPVNQTGKTATALVTNTGVIVANGGTVQLTARAADGIVQNLVQAGGTIRAATSGGHTGTVALNGVGGSIVVEGQLSAPGDAPGSAGGAITANATGNVTLTPAARLNASGKAGGGVVAVGTTPARAAGGPGVTSTQTAANVTVAAGATIAADATGMGNGGRVTVLSANTTTMSGSISAKGGPSGGDGGLVETSGPSLTIGTTATVDAGAPSSTGRPGTWQLDPFDIDITTADLRTGSTTAAGTTIFTAGGNFGTIANTTLASALDSNNVVVSTTAGHSDQQGNITVSSAINWTTANTLTLHADNNILVGNTITGTSGSLILSAGNTRTTGSITISSPISTNAFSASAGGAGTINLASTGTAVTTAGGGQTYGSPAVLQQTTALAETGNGTIGFTGTVDAATAGTQGLTVGAGTGAVTFRGAVGGSKALASLMVTGTGSTTLGGNVTTTGAQSYGGAVMLGATDTLTTTNNVVHFATTVDAATAGVQGLTVSAGTGAVTFGGAVGGSRPLATLMLTGAGPATLGGNVTTTGTQSYGGAVTLGAADILTTANHAVDFATTVDAAAAGAQGLTVSAGTGAVTFGGAVGALRALADLIVSGTGPTALDGNVTTTGVQNYGGAVRLGANDTLTTTNGAVDFAATVDATTGSEGLTVNAGTGAVTFGGAVGGSNALATLQVTGPGLTVLDGDVTSTGVQSYGGAVTLGATDTLTTNGSLVHFAGSVDAATTGVQGLTLSTGTGAVTFGSTVGTLRALASLMVTGTGPTTLDGNVTTAGVQSYDGAVTLGATDTLTTTGGLVHFGGTVDAVAAGVQGLTVSAGTGAVTFGGAVGGSQAPASLLVPGSGPVTLGGNVTTIGVQSYGGAVTLGATDTLTTSNSPVRFLGTLDAATAGVQGLIVNAGTGAVTFGGAAGAANPLASLTATGASITLGGNITVTRGLTLNSTGASSTLAIDTALSADQIALTASDISISGSASGTTSVTLTANSGGITETGSVSTALLTGSATTGALLTGSNQVMMLGSFTATTGFALVNTPNLAVTGTVDGGSNVTITDTGALTIPASVTGTMVDLTGASIGIPGMVSGPASVTLTATSGGITETGSVSTALLTGSAATSADLTQPGNLVGTLGAFSTSSGFALTDGQALVVAGPVIDTGAASALALTTRTGGITLAGTVSGANIVDLIAAGAINQTGGTLIAGTLTGSATTSASLMQSVNQIARISTFSASGLALTDGADLTISGNVNGGPSVTLLGSKTITVAAGGVVSGSAVTTTAAGNIDVVGAVQAGTSLALISDTGSIAETGTLTTPLLTGSAAGDASLTGTASSNSVVRLGSFSSGGTLTLVDGVALTIAGPLTAPTIVINTGANALTLADQTVITTGGTPRPSGTVTTFPGDTPATTTGGAFLTTAGGFIQQGTSTILGSNGPGVLRINAIGGANIAFDKTAGLQATNVWLILDIGSGSATGQIGVKDLDVIHTGQGGSASLTGSVTGLTGVAAAGAAGIQLVPDSNFQINSCPIHSVTCILLPTLSVPVQNPLNDIDIGTLFNPNEDQDLLLPIVSDQDY